MDALIMRAAAHSGALAAALEETGSFIWKIEDWSAKAREERLYSDVFVIGGKKWRLLAYPMGNKQTATHMSLYLDSSPEALANLPVAYQTSFLLTLHGHDGAPDVVKAGTQNFVPGSRNWGFISFVSLQDLRDPSLRLIAPDDSLTLSVHAKMSKINWDTYNSKQATGFVGLQNTLPKRGLYTPNSVVQMLFSIPAFRKAVYDIPTTAADSPDVSVALALQLLFCQLQLGADATANSEQLERTLRAIHYGQDDMVGWDVTVFTCVMIEQLSKQLEGTRLEDIIDALVKGRLQHTGGRSGTGCIHDESFLNLSLDVEGCSDVAASLQRRLADAIRWDDEPAVTTRFASLPPVLMLHLLRFRFDDTMKAYKVHDRFEFPLELDMNPPFLAHDAAARAVVPDARYVLHAVVSHAGSGTSGPIAAFVRPGGGTGDWFKFDDERVTRVEPDEALEDNYGVAGSSPSSILRKLGDSNRCAFLLVYLRAADMARLMCPVSEGDVPAHVRARADVPAHVRTRAQAEAAAQQAAQAEQQRKAREEAAAEAAAAAHQAELQRKSHADAEAEQRRKAAAAVEKQHHDAECAAAALLAEVEAERAAEAARAAKSRNKRNKRSNAAARRRAAAAGAEALDEDDAAPPQQQQQQQPEDDSQAQQLAETATTAQAAQAAAAAALATASAAPAPSVTALPPLPAFLSRLQQTAAAPPAPAASQPLPASLLPPPRKATQSPAAVECLCCFDEMQPKLAPVLGPCGHRAMCRACTEALMATPEAQRKCYVCAKKVTAVIWRVYDLHDGDEQAAQQQHVEGA